MKAVTFLLHTQQPILATSLQGDPNSDVSYHYIPGSIIRGVLIGRYLQRHGLRHTDVTLDNQRFPEIKQLFFNAQKTRYLNAYPADVDRKRTLPVPRSWYKDKWVEFSEKEETVYDFSKIPGDEQKSLVNEKEEKLSPKLLNEDFCTVNDDKVLLYRVKRRLNIHTQRDRKRGKGIEGNGAVFYYNAIDAKQTFQAVILCDSSENKAIIESLLQQKDTWIGGSQSAGYGHIIIELIQNENDDDWYEVGINTNIRLAREENLTITLLSDTILRNEWGQIVTEPEDLRLLISKLLTKDTELKFTESGTYASSLIVGGFNRKWGLPLPQTEGFAAGSVFVFEKFELDFNTVKKLEEEGIGERRVDGFGRFSVNWLDEHTEFRVKISLPTIKSESLVNTSELMNPLSLTIAEDIADRIVRKKLDELLMKQLSSIEISNKDKITNSQLFRLVIVARKALLEVQGEQEKQADERKKVVELGARINSLLHNLPSNSRKQFEQTILNDGQKFDDKILDLLKEDNTWIQNYWHSEAQTRHLVVDNQPTVTIAGVQRYFDAYTALEYSIRLIIAVAKKIIKEKNND